MTLCYAAPKKKMSKYSAGYRISSPEEFKMFSGHRWYIPVGERYITIPHWWGMSLTIRTAMKYIESGIYVAVKNHDSM